MATVQNGSKMRTILILTSILAVYAGVIKENCTGVNINGKFYELDVLRKDLDRPYLLAVSHHTNTLYFSYTADFNEDGFKTASINLKTNKFQIIKGVNNGFAQTVDQKTDDVYIGASDGIYKYDYKTDNAELFGAKGFDIWYIYFNDVLYFITYPSQFLYTLENNQITRFKDLEDTKVDNFVIDNNNTMFFTNASGLYSQEKGIKHAVFYEISDNIRSLTADINGKVYVCYEDSIFAVNKEKTVLEKVLDVDDAFGLAFDKHNIMIYSNATSLVRLNRSDNC